MKTEHQIDTGKTIIKFTARSRPYHSNGRSGHARDRPIDAIHVYRSGQIHIICSGYPDQVLTFADQDSAIIVINAIAMSLDSSRMLDLADELRRIRSLTDRG